MTVARENIPKVEDSIFEQVDLGAQPVPEYARGGTDLTHWAHARYGDLFTPATYLRAVYLSKALPRVFTPITYQRVDSIVEGGKKDRLLPGSFIASRIAVLPADIEDCTDLGQLIRRATRSGDTIAQVSVAKPKSRLFSRENSYDYTDHAFMINGNVNISQVEVAHAGILRHFEKGKHKSEHDEDELLHGRITDTQILIQKMAEEKRQRIAHRREAVNRVLELLPSREVSSTLAHVIKNVPFTEKPPGLLVSMFDPGAFTRYEDRREDHAFRKFD